MLDPIGVMVHSKLGFLHGPCYFGVQPLVVLCKTVRSCRCTLFSMLAGFYILVDAHIMRIHAHVYYAI